MTNVPHENAFYFAGSDAPVDGAALFGVLHAPAPGTEPKGAGWVICAPFGEERGNAQRMMVEWARVLAGEGFWVLRFDYRGTGDSEGDLEQLTFDDHVADALTAIAELEQRAGVLCRGLTGLRLGATVAALAAARHGGDALLVLWEPIVRGADYGDDLLRIVMTKQMTRTGQAPMTRDDLKEQLARGGHVVVEGHVVTDAYFQSLIAADLLDTERPGDGPALMVQIGGRKRPNPDLEALRDAYGASGPSKLEVARMPKPWALGKECDVRPSALFGLTLAWVREHAPATTAQPTGDPALAAMKDRNHDGAREQIVEFTVEGRRVSGVLNVPQHPDPNRPAVVMLSIANNCRTADARLYVRLGRRLARHGWPALRFDPRGVGDSEGDLEFPHTPALYCAIEEGLFVPDSRAAIAFLRRELGTRTVVLTGICGGAATAILHAEQDPRVVGVAPLEMALQLSPTPGLTRDVAVMRKSFVMGYFARRAPFRVALRRRLRSYRRRYRALLRTFRKQSDATATTDLPWFVQRVGPRPNARMIRALLQCTARRMPSFFIFAGTTVNPGRFSRIRSGLLRLCGDLDHVSHHVIKEADHVFSAPAHAEELFDLLIEWLNDPARPWYRSGE